MDIFILLSLSVVASCTFGVSLAFNQPLKTMAGSGEAVPLLFNGYVYETRYFQQNVDHFGFTNTDVYKQRYLINEQHWSAGNPIFFYTGNEGDITWFCNNTGFMWDIAPQFSAMLVFAEHRYYGESLPYGKDSLKNATYTDYLTSEQALADFVGLIAYIKKSTPGASHSKVVAFGGSYGGMLSTWIRLKYPNVVVGSIAASAPVWMFPGMNPCGVFQQTTTRTFNKSSPNCVENIRESWKTINVIGSTDAGRTFITDTFRLCKPLKSFDDIVVFKDWLNEALTNLAMVDYPYPANFLEPLPAWPVKAVCQPLSTTVYKDKQLLTRLSMAMNIYFNYTGHAKCLDINQDSTASLSEAGWFYQACTEMVSPTCTDNIHDMFEAIPWNFAAYSDACFEQWGVRPRPHWSEHEYGGKNIRDASNIVFSNGLLDPWSSLGVTSSISNTVISLIIPEGGHHLDLRSSNHLDPGSVIKVREREKSEILRWINEH